MLQLAKHEKRQQKKSKVPAILLVLFLFCLAGLCLAGAYLVYSQQVDLPFLTPQATLSVPEGPSTSSATRPQSTGTLQDFIDETIFVGDSRTNGLAKYGFVDSDRVYAIDGANHSTARTERFIQLKKGGKLLTIADAVGTVKPKYLMVSFGINGVAFMEEDTFFSEYALFLDELKAKTPDSVLIVQSILPVSAAYQQREPRMTNDKIKRYNRKLAQLAEQKGGLYFDTFTLFKDGKGNLSSTYDSGDGLHFNSRAYQAWLDNLDTYRKTI